MKRSLVLAIVCFFLLIKCNKKDDNLAINVGNQNQISCTGFTSIADTAFENSLIKLGYDTIRDGQLEILIFVMWILLHFQVGV